MKIIIAGSRSIIDYNIVAYIIETSKINITEIVCGMAAGVDLLGRQFGINNNIPIKEFYPDWNKYGKRAGFLRNEEMGLYADGLIAIHDGISKGTTHMINFMNKLKKPVLHVVIKKV